MKLIKYKLKKVLKVKRINIVKETNKELINKYKSKALSYRQLYVLDALLRDKKKYEIAEELGVCLATVYNIISSRKFQKIYMEEMQYKYDLMKLIRTAIYTEIAEKGLNIILHRLEQIEKQEFENDHGSMEKTIDILLIVVKMVNLMQVEDGIRKARIDVSEKITNMNINVNTTTKELDMRDEEFRKSMATILEKTKINNLTNTL
jgi:predicted transcriptional regulator